MGIYSEPFKARMVQRMVGPELRTASSLAEEVGVCQTTLSRWKREECSSASMAIKGTQGNRSRGPTTKPGRSKQARRPQDWTPEEKVRVVMESTALSDDALGAFLRREGLHVAQLAEWRSEVTSKAVSALKDEKKSSKKSVDAKRIRELEKELRRKDKALAEAAALLVLKKKPMPCWGAARTTTHDRRTKDDCRAD